ncbi:hypothetical protein M404DRAFT_18421 [Pisolithus tinctorius Marx 270]|uniref:Uncharacterized protein n=1 Tax=Pisolithus tinctorius Marx 270 TaxID=870435 RepID=A0A0C3KXE2_PISTI|nr:hypothetical protein M404DRAFT_18421 [Pisolithus tinctorius Marx 270]
MYSRPAVISVSLLPSKSPPSEPPRQVINRIQLVCTSVGISDKDASATDATKITRVDWPVPSSFHLVERTAGDWLGVTLDGLMNHLTADPRGLGCFYVLRGFPPPPPSTHSHSPGHWLIFDAWACGLMGVPLTQ